MSRRSGTDGSLLGSLPFTLTALAIAIVPHLPYLPLWVTAAFIGCSAARLIIEQRRWRLPGPFVRMLLALLCFVAVLGSYETISGVGPGSALLTIMAALKLLETRQRRDQYVLLFLAIFLIMSSLLREQYVWSLPYMLAGVAITLGAWLQMSAVGHGRAGRARRAFGSSLRIVAYAAPLMLAMWVFFPRIATPFWAVPIDTSSGVSGISDEMSPGDITALSASNAVAFRVRFEGEIPAQESLYWRGLVLTRFDGRKWSSFDPIFGRNDDAGTEYLGDPVRYRVTMEPTRQQWVFALDVPADWNLDDTFMGRQQQLARVYPIDQLVAFDATSYTNYRLDPDRVGFRPAWYLEHPNGSNPRTVALARDLRAQAGSDDAYVEAVLERFRNEPFYYSLEPPGLGTNAVDQFLFDTREGFCEHYASAFGLLMRAAGLPARVVVGYQGGDVNEMTGQLVVRQSDAHAWNEVWIAGKGWRRVDPTSAVAPERIRVGMGAARFTESGALWGLSAPSRIMFQLELTWDAINAHWNEWVVAYGPERQQSFMEWLGMENPTLRKMLFALIGIVTLLLVLVAGLLAWRGRPPSGDPLAKLYRRFQTRTGLEPVRGEAPLSFATRIAREAPELSDQGAAIVRRYLELRYGDGSDGASGDLKAAIANFGGRRRSAPGA